MLVVTVVLKNANSVVCGSLVFPADLRTRTVDPVGSGDVLRNGQIGRRKTQLTSESASVLHNAFDQNPFHQIFSVSLRTSRNCEKNSLAKTRSTV